MFSDLREEEIDRLREEIRRISETRKVYKENLKLCKWQEQQINRLATAIEKVAKLVEGTYEALDPQALKEIRHIIKEQTNERNRTATSERNFGIDIQEVE